MTKKKKVLIVLGVVLVIVLSFLGGQVYSKYVARVKGEGIAEIAAWKFKVNNQEEQIQKISLKSTYNNKTLINNKIAPGTSGSFNIIIDGTGSDVGINYTINFTNESSKPKNLKFIYNNIEYDSITKLTEVLSGTIDANEEEKNKTFLIGWKWEYESGNTNEEIENNDVIDTQNAKDISNYTFDIVVTGTQVQPQEV